VRENKVFNKPESFVEGWYWVCPSGRVKAGQLRAVSVLGRELAVYRAYDGQAHVVDAHCPHMGAHLAEGRVDGNGLRCLFHNWNFDERGACVSAPALKSAPDVCLRSWPTSEKYGMVWIWTGQKPEQALPFVPELEHQEVDVVFGNRFEKSCHPNVVMINAIDAHHFNTVHNLPVDLLFETKKLNDNAISFSNTTKIPDKSRLTRFLGRFYAGPLTYKMSYWFGSTGTVTIGPDFMHFHIMFALRMLDNGRTEGQTILVTRKRKGLFGFLFNRVALFLTRVVGDYFARGDTQIFESIKFDFKTPTSADRSIIDFIENVEAQKTLNWASWDVVKEARVEVVEIAS
jgi:phenylpropionate dioxygenase-like ring-hydroxylating dioxygenase large terminal subunit